MEIPNVYIFNPTCDMAVLNQSVSYMPPARLRIFESDLATMLHWLASPRDFVVVNDLPDNEFLSRHEHLGIELPTFVTWDQLQKSGTPLRELRPWGWSPEIHHRVKTLKPRCDEQFRKSSVASWKPEHMHFFSRQTNQRLIRAITTAHPHIAIAHTPVEARSVKEALSAMAHFGQKAVLKTPWSSSGRGMAMSNPTMGRTIDTRWIEGAIKQQGYIMVEPLYNKVADMSFHFWLHPNGKLDYLGHNFFMTDHSGKFQGCHLNDFPNIADIADNTTIANTINDSSEILSNALSSLDLHLLYSGPVGVDALWYRHSQGMLKLHPAIETNLRYTMGLVNLMMRKKLSFTTYASWQIAQFDEGQWSHFCQQKLNEMPLTTSNGAITQGFLPLTPMNSRSFGAWMELSAHFS